MIPLRDDVVHACAVLIPLAWEAIFSYDFLQIPWECSTSAFDTRQLNAVLNDRTAHSHFESQIVTKTNITLIYFLFFLEFEIIALLSTVHCVCVLAC